MTDSLKKIIDSFPLGFVFTSNDFHMLVENPKKINKVLNDFVSQDYLRKISKGRFYKPHIGKCGESLPDIYQTVKDLLVRNGKMIGYLTGYAIFNDLMLTTQAPTILQIGMHKEKRAIVRSNYRIHFFKQENSITKSTIPLLRLLDCLRFFKIIPDITPDSACQRIICLLKSLDEQQITKIKRLALNYTPQAIALLGAMLETINPADDTDSLYKKLNQLTVYKLYISKNYLPTQKKWNIR